MSATEFAAIDFRIVNNFTCHDDLERIMLDLWVQTYEYLKTRNLEFTDQSVDDVTDAELIGTTIMALKGINTPFEVKHAFATLHKRFFHLAVKYNQNISVMVSGKLANGEWLHLLDTL